MVVIWDLAAKQGREILIPAPFNGGFGMGMTKTHVWVMGRNPKGNTSALFRFSLK